jgi:succinoglycan biosynthesis protein ExoM
VTNDGNIVPGRTRVAVAICTFKRNDLLTRLLDALLVCAKQVSARAAVGVIIVDDTPDGLARPVAEAFKDRFELGLQFRISGQQNISLARNLAVETAIGISDWTAMTDDDCEPPADWINALLDIQQRTMAHAVTGRMIRRVPEEAPRWIIDQPFLELGVETPPDGADMPTAATFNTLISSEWLKMHPDIRFSAAYGVIGGEDMVFFRAAKAAGLEIRFSEKGFTFENEPAERATFAYQLYVYLWHGNSAARTCMENKMSRSRLIIHSCASLMRAMLRPVSRLGRGEKPQLRFALAQVLHAIGKLVGTLGVQLKHR